MKTLMAVLGIVSFSLIGVGRAFAADAFTLEIPVEFKSLNPAVKSVLIRCVLEGPDPITKRIRAYGPVKTLNLALSNGNYTGLSPVKIVYQSQDFAPADQSLLEAVSAAQCGFALVTATGSLPAANGATTNPILEHKNGTPYEALSHGNVAK